MQRRLVLVCDLADSFDVSYQTLLQSQCPEAVPKPAPKKKKKVVPLATATDPAGTGQPGPGPGKPASSPSPPPQGQKFDLIRHLEAKYGGGQLDLSSEDDESNSASQGQGTENPKRRGAEDWYEDDDGFIDDSELVHQEEERDRCASTKTRHQGFFVSTGILEVEIAHAAAVTGERPATAHKGGAPKVPVQKHAKTQDAAAKKEAARTEKQAVAEEAEAAEAAAFSRLSEAVSAQIASSGWMSKWSSYEHTAADAAAAATSAAAVEVGDEESAAAGAAAAASVRRPQFPWTANLSSDLLGASEAWDLRVGAVNALRKASRAVKKESAEDLSIKAERDRFMSAVEALWPAGAMDRKKISSRMQAERKSREAAQSEKALAAAAAWGSAIVVEGSSSALAAGSPAPAPRPSPAKPVPTRGQEGPVAGSAFPDMPFPGAGLSVGVRVVLPGFGSGIAAT